MNEISEYLHKGKKVRITYLPNRGYYIVSINSRLLPQHFSGKLEAWEARRLIDQDEAPGIECVELCRLRLSGWNWNAVQEAVVGDRVG